jgi:hypothetical protein
VSTWGCKETLSTSATTILLSLYQQIRVASHYGRRWRGSRFSAIILQEIKNPALSTLYTRGQSPKVVALQNAYIVVLFDQGDGLSKEVWVGQDWKTQTMVERFLLLTTSKYDKMLVVGLEGLFWARTKVRCFYGFGLWAWPLEASHYAWLKAPIPIFLLAIFNSFLWTLNKVWPFNPMASRLGRP